MGSEIVRSTSRGNVEIGLLRCPVVDEYELDPLCPVESNEVIAEEAGLRDYSYQNILGN